jgi:ABC-type bacteriocin/lantibiotic exporter with double-glycine peptidase domain
LSDDIPEHRMTTTFAWPRLAIESARPVVKQSDEDGCGAACGVMLLADRGVDVRVADVETGLPMPSMGHQIAARLNQLSDLRWQGGSLGVEGRVTRELVEFISGRAGSWAALLEPFGPTRAGHWVVVDGVSGDGLVLIRDPAGSAYGIPMDDFGRLWSYTGIVFREDRP